MLRPTSLLLSLSLATGTIAQDFGTVYTLSNATASNSVTVTLRLPNGGLLPFAEFSTAGTGTGGGLGSQGALAASDDGRVLLATNPGSDQVSVFRVFFGLFMLRTDVEASGGTRPTSVALHGNLVYVLNAGSDSVAGFRIHNGQLTPIAGANYGLSQAGAAAAQVGFSPNGHFLVVTERATNRIGVFAVMPNGTLGAGHFQPS
ncbi:MAG: beta-propeller fold lactonase family protein, partial [Planctomycetota bacterium]